MLSFDYKINLYNFFTDDLQDEITNTGSLDFVESSQSLLLCNQKGNFLSFLFRLLLLQIISWL